MQKEKAWTKKKEIITLIKFGGKIMARKKGCKYGKLKSPTKKRKCKKRPKGRKKKK